MRRTHSSTAAKRRTTATHILFRSATFEYAETIDEMEHKIATQRIVFRIGNAARCHSTGNITSLLQNVVYLKTQRSLVVLQERFGQRSIPQHLFLLKSFCISRIGRPINIAFHLKIIWQIKCGTSSDSIIKDIHILLSLQGVASRTVPEVAT